MLVEETGIEARHAEDLVKLAIAIRKLDTPRLSEVASMRSLVSTARLCRAGLPLRDAAHSAIALTLSEDVDTVRARRAMIDTYLKS